MEFFYTQKVLISRKITELVTLSNSNIKISSQALLPLELMVLLLPGKTEIQIMAVLPSALSLTDDS